MPNPAPNPDSRFKKGNTASLGKGRPKETYSAANMRAGLAKEEPVIRPVLIAKCMEGYMAAIRLFYAKFLPSLKAESLPVAFPVDPNDLKSASATILSLMGLGEISPDAGQSLMASLSSIATIHESEEFKQRLDAFLKANES